MQPGTLATMSERAAGLARPVGLAPWRELPETGEYIHARNSIEVPAADDSYNVITTFTVQAGYAAVITHLLFNFVGTTPPVDGDAGSIFYSLRVDQGYFPRQFGQISSTLGSLTNGPYPIPGYLRLKAGQTLEGLVVVPSTSSISTGPGNWVICHLLGWQWPDR